LAKGRVWTGAKAKELGLVDELGGLDAALAEAQKLGKVDAATDVTVYPPTPTVRDIVKSFGDVDSGFGTSLTDGALAAVKTIDPQLGAEAARLVELALSFKRTQIQAIAVLPIIR